MSILLRRQAPLGQAASLPPLPGAGPPLLCAPQPEAVATAQRLYPDRRIEVRRTYAEPGLDPGRWLLAWMLRPRPHEEAPEEVRRRVVETSVRLVGLDKEHQEAVIVAGPRLLRLLALKLNSIGYRGPFRIPGDPRHPKEYRYAV